ncbi:TonB-dependent receptor [Fusobacterium sp. PH5-44]|uniref:TonB-dependent receptor n=1 Tax=unclassified Fusobacterium TaxID=2648384 RepID=UPI003D227482
MSMKKLLLASILISASAFTSEDSIEPAVIDLGNSVIYSTTGFQTTVRDVASSPTIIISEDIEKKHYKTVDEILKDIPAVNLQYQMGMPIVDMRGQGNQAKTNVQILVDGIPTNSLDTSMVSSSINTIAVNSIDRIEVIPGGGAVLYGSGTSGGVVNIITKKQSGPRATAGYSYGNTQGSKYDVSAGYTFGKLDVDLAYTRNDIKGYRKYSEEDSDYFQGKVRFEINEDHNISFKYTNFSNDKELPDSLTKEQLKQRRKQSGKNPGDTDIWKIDKEEFVFDYQGKFTDNLDFSLSAFYQTTDMNYKSDSDSRHGRNWTGPGYSVVDMDANFDDEKKGIKAKLRYSYGNDSTLVFGMDYIDNHLDRNMVNQINSHSATSMGPMTVTTDMDINVNTNIKLDKKTISAFILNTYKHNNWEFIQGFRYERANYDIFRSSYTTTKGQVNMITPAGTRPIATIGPAVTGTDIKNKKDMNNFALELAINYLYSDTGNIYLKYERGFTSPAPALLTNRYDANDMSVPVHLRGEYYLNDLDSETYNSVELGLRDYFWNSNVSAVVFFTQTKDEIRSSGHTASTSEIINYNLDKTRRFGFELAASQDVGKFTFTESFSYVDAKVKKGDDRGHKLAGNRIAYVPSHKLSLGVLYQFNDKFSLGTDLVYHGGMYLTASNEGGKVNSHTVVNVKANFKATNSLNIYAGINNVLDKKYNDYVSYSTSTKEFSYDPAAERNYYVGFKYQF